MSLNFGKRLSKRAQAGFTLVELVVVIVVLGILAATALPKMFDVSSQARLAKLTAAYTSMKTASEGSHATWLAAGGILKCKVQCLIGPADQSGSIVTAGGATIPMLGGYPDVGGDDVTNTDTSATASGIFVAAGLTTTDYTVSATKSVLTVQADAQHPNCKFTFTEGTQTADTVGTSTAAGTQPTASLVPAFGSLPTAQDCA